MNTVDKSPASLIGPDGKRFVVDAGSPIRLGRSADNDIVISDKSVSRYHAAISIENGRCTIRDLGSQNGTFVSGRRISSAEILHGQQVRFGDLELTLNNPVGHQDGPQPSEPAADTQPASVGWWRFRSVQAGALAAAKHATRDEPQNWSDWLVVSRLQAESGHPAAAIAAYRRARSLNPRSSLFER